MSWIRRALLLVLAPLLCTCAVSIEKLLELREQSHATGICAIHDTPLKTEAGFKQMEGVCILRSEAFYKVYYRYPNPIPLDWAERNSELFQTPGDATYCSTCEQAVKNDYSASRSKGRP